VQIIEVTDLAVRSAVIRLRRRQTSLQFVIYPMVHMGQAAFYAEVASRLRNAQVVVAGGVGRGPAARPSALAAALTFSYTALRFNRLDPVEQDIDYQALGVLMVNPDVDMDEFRDRGGHDVAHRGAGASDPSERARYGAVAARVPPVGHPCRQSRAGQRRRSRGDRP
jgi:hypothetical protein